MVARLIDLGKLLAEVEQHTAGEQKKNNQPEVKLPLASSVKAPSRPKRYTQST